MRHLRRHNVINSVIFLDSAGVTPIFLTIAMASMNATGIAVLYGSSTRAARYRLTAEHRSPSVPVGTNSSKLAALAPHRYYRRCRVIAERRCRLSHRI